MAEKLRQKQSHPFPPLYDENSRILILGSFPSVKSREQMFFYGHPQNRFWRVIAAVFNDRTPETIDEKKKFLHSHGIALWDVIESCEITGSSDSSIQNVKVNDLRRILLAADIREIYVNGGTAYKYYHKYTEPVLGRSAVKLPSTSPANAACSLDRLVEEWSCIRKHLEMKPPMITFEAVYEIVRRIPRGKVATYGQIARMLGNVRWARIVGYALHDNPDGDLTPCYRVVNKDGKVSEAFVFGGKNRQIELLENDGIEMDGEYVALEVYQWDGK